MDGSRDASLFAYIIFLCLPKTEEKFRCDSSTHISTLKTQIYIYGHLVTHSHIELIDNHSVEVNNDNLVVICFPQTNYMLTGLNNHLTPTIINNSMFITKEAIPSHHHIHNQTLCLTIYKLLGFNKTNITTWCYFLGLQCSLN